MKELYEFLIGAFWFIAGLLGAALPVLVVAYFIMNNYGG